MARANELGGVAVARPVGSRTAPQKLMHINAFNALRWAFWGSYHKLADVKKKIKSTRPALASLENQEDLHKFFWLCSGRAEP